MLGDMYGLIKVDPSYGLWEITTASDGFMDISLGVHEGHLDEIALKLADKCNYYLKFERVDQHKLKQKKPCAVEVAVRLSNNMFTERGQEAAMLQDVLSNRDVSIIEGTYGFIICSKQSLRAKKEKERETKRAAAMAKLTEEDKEILGLQ